jgi:hypothetical protein
MKTYDWECIEGEASMVLTRLLEVRDRRPELFDDSTADEIDSPYSSDLLDALHWALATYQHVVAADVMPRALVKDASVYRSRAITYEARVNEPGIACAFHNEPEVKA